MQSIRTMIVLVLLVSISGCSLLDAGEAPDMARALLEGTSWELVTIAKEGEEAAPPADQEYTLAFGEAQLLVSRSDCNWLYGEYRVLGDARIALSLEISTYAACSNPGSLYGIFDLQVTRAESYEFADDRLILYQDEENYLVFRASADTDLRR